MIDRHGPRLGATRPPRPAIVDLHTHTTRSDGVLGPESLVRAAAAVGVRTLAITDHDTLAGYRELVAADAVPAGLELIAGVEINAVGLHAAGIRAEELHILGYGLDPADDAFEAVLASQRAARRERFRRTVERLRDAGLAIDAQVDGLRPDDESALGRPTVARALVAAGHATSVEDAFERLIGRGGPGFVPRSGLGPTEAIDAVRAAGGLPSLAHFSEAPGELDLVRELRERGLGGLEVYYRTFDAPTVEIMAAVADRLALVPTGGSDYHGDLMPYAQTHAELWVPPFVADRVRIALEARTRGRDR